MDYSSLIPLLIEAIHELEEVVSNAGEERRQKGMEGITEGGRKGKNLGATVHATENTTSLLSAIRTAHTEMASVASEGIVLLSEAAQLKARLAIIKASVGKTSVGY